MPPDTASQSTPQLDTGELRHTLSIHDVEAALVAARVPRSHRQVIRYCENGMLDAVKVPGPTGDQWYVAPASLPKAIGDLKQWEAQRARQSTTQQDTSNHVALKTPPTIDADTTSHGTPQHAMSGTETSQKGSETRHDTVRHGETESATPGYVAQLEKRIEEKDDFITLLKGQLVAKDEQISELSTRYRETHTLLGAMQRMFAPLLGQRDPYTPAETTAEGTRVDNPTSTS